MIIAKDIYRRQGGLSGVSLRAMTGAVTAVLGPNGAGKSTLLDVLAGRSMADSGTVGFNDRSISSWPAQELARSRAFLPQSAEVAFPIRVRDLVALGRSPYRSLPEMTLDGLAIETALRQTDAWVLRDRVYQRLSGGERQRVQLARVIAQVWRPVGRDSEPRMLLLDEPTASLDPGHRLAVMRLLRDLAGGGIGIVIALHDLNDALRFADHAVLLKGGRLHDQGSPQSVLTSEALARVYEAPTEIVAAVDGRPVVIFG